MASHTEPHGRHTKEELMHPGRDHHLRQTPSNEVPCPDPSMHRNTKLQEQASTAALYVTSPAKKIDPREGLLDKDGKLSSRSTITTKSIRQEDVLIVIDSRRCYISQTCPRRGSAQLSGCWHRQHFGRTCCSPCQRQPEAVRALEARSFHERERRCHGRKGL